MKQARWCLLLAAMWLLPTAAMAQPAKPAGGAPPAGGAAAPSGDSIELDEPKPDQPKPDQPPGGDTPPPGGTPGGTGGGICEIDPSACPKQADLGKAAKRDIAAEVYAVQQIYFLRRGRFEVQPYWSFTLNDQFVNHPGPGLAVNYYLTNVLAVGINGTFYQPFNVERDFNFQNRRASRVAVPLNEYQMNAAANFTYVPMYGKFAGFSQFIFSYDAYVVGGVGIARTKPIPVIDPDNRKFEFDNRLSFNVGIGLRIALNRWFAITTEVRDYIYVEQLEALTVAQTQEQQQNQSTWFGEKPLTNNIQAQLGVAIFLPFSWDYRLPR